MFTRDHESQPFVVFRSGTVFPASRISWTAPFARASPCFAVAKLGFQTVADVFCHDLPRSLLCRSREKTHLLGVHRSTSAQASVGPAVATHSTGPAVRSTTWKIFPPSLVVEMAPGPFFQIIPLPTSPCRASQKAIEFGTSEAGVRDAGLTLFDGARCTGFALCLAPPHPLDAASSESPKSAETRARGTDRVTARRLIHEPAIG
jgi:hypothetical protein